MNFNSPIPRSTQPYYAEGSGLRSIRDADALGRQWSKNAGVSEQNQGILQALSKLQTDVNRILRRKTPVLQTFESFYPFKLYQPNNIASFVGVICPFVVAYAAGAALQTCMVTDAATPTDLTASPPTISIADTWRFWAIRSGYIEYRNNYPNDIQNIFNNLSCAVPVQNTDFIQKTYLFDYYGLADIEFDKDTSATVNPPLVLGIDVTGLTVFSAFFWIAITPDMSNAKAGTATICGYVSPTEIVDTTQVFDSLTNMDVPVAMMDINVGSFASTISQLLFDHARNRYPAGNGNFGASCQQMNFRGQWNIASSMTTTIPPDLASQVFYPGDVIAYVDHDTLVSGLYQKTTYSIDQISGTPASDAKWIQILNVPITS